MAGIAGIVVTSQSADNIDLKRAGSRAMEKLSWSDLQKRETYHTDKVFLGNAMPLSSDANNRFVYCKALNIYAVIDGMVLIDDVEKIHIKSAYSLEENKNVYELLPYLYKEYGESITAHITGWYNIFIHDISSNTSFLFNDPLGYLPLYIHQSKDFILFSSKIESILNTGLIAKPEFDATTIAEHLLYNYPLSDYTYIKGVETLSNGESLLFTNGHIKRDKYWNISELYGQSPLDNKSSFDLMNESLRQATHKIADLGKSRVNFTLTGGWDSRVVLSYFLPEFKEHLHFYSFGAPHSDDIQIPSYIAAREKLNYTPYILDQEYLDNCFMESAINTILLSNGTRNFKRAHYLYAIQQASSVSDLVVTGIFGDEVFKVAQAVGGTVLTKNAINLLQSDFNVDAALGMLRQSAFYHAFEEDTKKQIVEKLAARTNDLNSYLQQFENTSQKYYALRFEINLRKYFGNEVNSYNDYCYSFSPFIDFDFLKNFAKTGYFGVHFPFNSNSLRLKKVATQLYYALTKANYPRLTKYNSARGYSMQDSATYSGNVKILLKKYLNKKKNVDAFNTGKTDDIFRRHLSSALEQKTIPIFNRDLIKTSSANTDMLSLVYFLNHITTKY